MLHGRDDERGEAALAEIFTTTGSDRLTWFRADFAELAQVRSLVERVARRFDRLDVVVSNAGIGTTVPGGDARLVSADGYELRFAVNDLAGFLLAQRLEPLLSAAPGGRFVSVSSARQGALDFNDVMLERSYSGLQAHRQSKLAQIMMTFDRAERFAASGVAAAILHPSTFMPTKTVATPTSSVPKAWKRRRALSRVCLQGKSTVVTSTSCGKLALTRRHTICRAASACTN